MSLKLSKHLILFFVLAMVSIVSAQSNNNTRTGRDTAYIDTHNHLSGGPMWRSDYSGATRNALAEMDELGIGENWGQPLTGDKGGTHRKKLGTETGDVGKMQLHIG